MSDIMLKGKIIGFEEYNTYSLQDAFGDTSPFRLLACVDVPISFAVVNPFSVFDDYTFELEENLLEGLGLNGNTIENIAILCIIRPHEDMVYINLRSPIIINTDNGCFSQVVLQNESYGVSVPFTVKDIKE